MIDQMSAFLQKLRKSTAGNTLAIAAAALVPLVGMVGGAVDISRYYMAVARMQNACDAGALAARKQMDSDTLSAEDRTLGLRFFDQNYPDGTFGLENLDRDYVADENGTVTGTATGDMPTTIMQIFGKTGMDIAVSCSAEINISNTDIMFVLDVTGSMNCPDDAAAGTCLNNGNVEASNARIRGLRAAVLDFYDVVEEATSESAQVRYGIVPYASNVNVGASIPTQFMATEHTYQSREAQDPTLEQWWETVSANFENTASESYVGRSDWNYCSNTPANIDLYYVEGSGSLNFINESTNGSTRTRVYKGSGTLRRGVGQTSWYYGTCYRRYAYYERYGDFDLTVIDERREEMVFDDWIYKPVTYDVSAVLTGGTFMAPIERDGNYLRNVEIGWNNGCIEEASTNPSATWDPIPADAYDLDINLKPTVNEQKWKPMLRDLVWKREDGWDNHYGWLYQTGDESRPSFECPKAAFRLTEIERDDLENYLLASNGFIARSSTYHDLGMIWGARFISPRGIFEADNEAAPNGDLIARHLIFMTDGELMVSDELYGTYGIEWWDRRVSPDGSSSQSRHAERFLAACRQARANGITVWVVAFGTALTDDLIECADNEERDFVADDSDDLKASFQEIAQRIAALRLTS